MGRPRKYADPTEWPNKLDEKSILIVLGYRQPKALTRMLEEGLPRRADGYFDLCQVVPWILKRSAVPADEMTLKAAKTEQEIQKIKLEIQKREMDLSVAKAESITRAEHREILTEQARYVVASVRLVCDDFAPRVVGIDSLQDGQRAMDDMKIQMISRISGSSQTNAPDISQPETQVTIDTPIPESTVDRGPARRVQRGYQAASSDIGLVF